MSLSWCKPCKGARLGRSSWWAEELITNLSNRETGDQQPVSCDIVGCDICWRGQNRDTPPWRRRWTVSIAVPRDKFFSSRPDAVASDHSRAEQMADPFTVCGPQNAQLRCLTDVMSAFLTAGHVGIFCVLYKCWADKSLSQTGCWNSGDGV